MNSKPRDVSVNLIGQTLGEYRIIGISGLSLDLAVQAEHAG